MEARSVVRFWVCARTLAGPVNGCALGNASCDVEGLCAGRVLEARSRVRLRAASWNSY